MDGSSTKIGEEALASRKLLFVRRVFLLKVGFVLGFVPQAYLLFGFASSDTALP
jgi:hypothetical protein